MLDAIETEVFNKLFSSIAEEMGIVLTRSSFSSNIKERRDFSCAVFDGDARLVAQASHIPVHLGSMPATLSEILKELSLSPGDIVINNDPYRGGSHLPDITLVEGVFASDSETPDYYVVNRAHHADVGGLFPGSMGICRSLDEEGIRIAPAYLYHHGRPNRILLDHFLGNVRNPEERFGDLRAQQASLTRGRSRLLELLKKYGRRHLVEVQGELFAYGRRLMEATIAGIADGTYRFTDYLDDDGFGGGGPVRLSVAITINGSQATIDFSGSADQVEGPLNTVKSVTVSATIYAFLCLLGEGYPVNHGSYAPLTHHLSGGINRQRFLSCRGRRRQRRNQSTHRRCALRGPGTSCAGSHSGGKLRQHEQYRHWRHEGQRQPIQLLRDHRRWHGRAAGGSRTGRDPYPHDQHHEHPGGGP